MPTSVSDPKKTETVLRFLAEPSFFIPAFSAEAHLRLQIRRQSDRSPASGSFQRIIAFEAREENASVRVRGPCFMGLPVFMDQFCSFSAPQ